MDNQWHLFPHLWNDTHNYQTEKQEYWNRILFQKWWRHEIGEFPIPLSTFWDDNILQYVPGMLSSLVHEGFTWPITSIFTLTPQESAFLEQEWVFDAHEKQIQVLMWEDIITLATRTHIDTIIQEVEQDSLWNTFKQKCKRLWKYFWTK